MDVHRCDDEKSDNIGHPEEVTNDDLHKSDTGKNEKGAQKCKFRGYRLCGRNIK